MSERSWKRAVKGEDQELLRYKDHKDSEGRRILMPSTPIRVMVKYGYQVELRGYAARNFDRKINFERFKESDRSALDAHGLEWKEPSEWLDEMVADFRHELELAMKDAMPWDGEYNDE
jgi:hypothetical protein